jgi:hypothetical protein
VGDILKNRQFEQLNVQNQMSNLAKTIQAQRQNEAFGEQASNAGLLPGVDTSNLSADQTAALAKLVQQQGSEATMDAYKRALGAAVTTRANAYAADKNAPDDGSGEPATPETYTDPNTGLTWARRPGGKWQLLPRYGQRNTATPGTGDNAPSLDPQLITPDDTDSSQPAPPPAQIGPSGPPSSRVPPKASTGAALNMPKKGDIVGGYAYVGEDGSDPNNPKNWTPAGQP